MNREPTRKELEALPVPDHVQETLRQQEETYRDRLIDSQAGYWNTLATLHSVILSAASIVTGVQPESPTWAYLAVAVLCVVGVASVGWSFKLMRGFYDDRMLHSSVFQNMATLDDHYKRELEKASEAVSLKRRRKSLQRTSEWCFLGSVLALVLLVLF